MDAVFSLKLHHRDNRTEIIECKQKGLLMKVLPRDGNLANIAETDMVFRAKFSNLGLNGKPITEQAKSLVFLVMNPTSPYRQEWKSQLFVDAIDWYIVQHLKKKRQGAVFASIGLIDDEIDVLPNDRKD